MTEQLKELRLNLDGLAQQALKMPDRYNRTMAPNEMPPAVTAAASSILMAKAWTGKLLGELGSATPYKNDGNRASVKDIEPTDAQAEASNWDEDLNYVQRIDQLRERIADFSYKLKEMDLRELNPSREAAICRTEIWTYLVEARMHLGFELGRIREVNHKAKNPATPAEAYKPEPTVYDWAKYRRTDLSEMRPYVKGEDLSKVSVSKEDDPETDMGMIARNPKNHADKWYVSRKYFNDNLEPA